jgi:hypothetical protein
MHASLSTTSVKTGSVTFSVRNGLEPTGMHPGATKPGTTTLAGGPLALWFPVSGHAAPGTSSTSTGGGWG